MDSRALTKLTRPHTDNTFQRDRLFDLLDQATSSPVTWISAQAGSGKTQLVASYLESRKKKTLWYQIDSSDNDHASFFYYLGAAAKNLTRKDKSSPFPLFTPEYTFGLNVFSRRFFEKIIHDLSDSYTLVFDDFHLLDTENPLHQAIVHGIDTLPASYSVIIITRSLPNESYAELQINRKLTLIDNKQVNLTLEEIDGFLTHHNYSNKAGISSTIFDYTRGWIAGTSLLIDTFLHDSNIENISSFLDESNLYNYFSNIVSNIPKPEIKEFLLSTAYLPRFTQNMAEQLSGIDNCSSLINYLYTNNLFLTRYGSNTPFYQYHPLFSDFLKHWYSNKYPGQSLNKLQSLSGDLLLSQGLYKQAADLFINSHNWDRLITVILSKANELILQGRANILNNWLSQLPDIYFSQKPWLTYWYGLSVFPFDMSLCRQRMIQALDCFEKSNNKEGVYLSWVRIIESYTYSMSGFTQLNQWIDRLPSIELKYGSIAGETYEAYVASSMFTALVLSKPEHPDILHWSTTSQGLTQNHPDISLRINNLFQQALFSCYMGRHHSYDYLMSLITHNQQDRAITPFQTIQLLLAEFLIAIFTYNFSNAESIYQQALKICHETGIVQLIPVFNSNMVTVLIFNHHIDKAKSINDINLSQIALLPTWDQTITYQLHARILLAQGQPEAAWEFSQKDLSLTESIGYIPGIIFAYITACQILIALGRSNEAVKYSQLAITLSESITSPLLCYYSLMQYAYIELKHGDHVNGINLLARALKIAKPHDYETVYTWHLPTSTYLYITALENDIESDFVLHKVQALPIPAESIPAYLSVWPWPVKIYTLGQFSVVKDGGSLQFQSKSQKKPLELLNILIALGGSSVAESSVTDLLWPSADGDASHRSMATTLHRLRKLLGSNAIFVSGGRISINRQYCWIDSEAMLSLIKHVLSSLSTNQINQADLLKHIDSINTLYSGHFHDTDDLPGWALSYREKLRAKYLSFVSNVASHLEADQLHHHALSLYRKGIETDPLSENFYQGAMRCYLALGSNSEAIRIYHQCASQLAQSMHIEPSAVTQHLLKLAYQSPSQNISVETS